MRKGELTKRQIVARSAELFNQKGYFGSSLTDIMDVTGLKKGGIYNHFQNKDEIALAAFHHAVEVLDRHYTEVIKGKKSAVDQLLAVLTVYEDVIDNPPLPGGCPILNAAVESDDAYPALRDSARQAMDRWLRFIQVLLRKAIKRNEIRPDIDVQSVATYVTSAFEGGIMLSKLYDDPTYIRQTIKHLTDYVETLRARYNA
jgi:TetR/AcrR family transcriptional regulator, transcriptional repressor for nem operon